VSQVLGPAAAVGLSVVLTCFLLQMSSSSLLLFVTVTHTHTHTHVRKERDKERERECMCVLQNTDVAGNQADLS